MSGEYISCSGESKAERLQRSLTLASCLIWGLINSEFIKFSVHNVILQYTVAIIFHGIRESAIFMPRCLLQFVTLPEKLLYSCCCLFGCHNFASDDVLSLFLLLTLQVERRVDDRPVDFSSPDGSAESSKSRLHDFSAANSCSRAGQYIHIIS